MWYILLFVMWFSPYVFINVSTFNQCDIYFCLSCGFHPMCLLMSGLSTNVIYTSVCHVVFTLCVYKCQDFQPMWYILLFVMWFSPYVFINVSTFNQCDIYLFVMWFSVTCGFHLCVYKCQDFQPMWYILLFVMWFSSYVFINVRTFNQCDIYFCLSCGFHSVFINVRAFNQCDIYFCLSCGFHPMCL